MQEDIGPKLHLETKSSASEISDPVLLQFSFSNQRHLVLSCPFAPFAISL